MAESEETVSLTTKQRRRAMEILDRVADGEVEVPEDIVDDWTYFGRHHDYREIVEQLDVELTRKKAHIPVSDIAGTTHNEIEMMQNRIERALRLLLSGEYKIEPQRPPKLEKLDNKYYVSVDGHHRVAAFKALGLETMYVEFVDLPLP